VQLSETFGINRDVSAVYLHRFIFKLALSPVTVFLPLYIYNLSQSTTPVFIYFLLFYGLRIPIQIIASWFSSRVGYKRSAMIAAPFILLFYYSIQQLETAGTSLYAAAALGSAAFTLYWTGINAEMAAGSTAGKRGEQTGVFISSSILASIIAPVLSGILIAATRFTTFFTVIIATMAVSFLPFLLRPENFAGMSEQADALISWTYLTDFLTYVSRGIMNIGRKMVWPLYLGIIITGEVTIGTAGSLMAVGGAAASLTIGRLLTEKTKTPILYTGGFLFTVTTIAMGFTSTPTQAFIVSLASGTLIHSINLPLFAGAMGQADASDILGYFAMREIGLCTGRTIVITATLLSFSYLPTATAFTYSFAAVAAGSIGAVIFGSAIQ